jgi:hypothetical protein
MDLSPIFSVLENIDLHGLHPMDLGVSCYEFGLGFLELLEISIGEWWA